MLEKMLIVSLNASNLYQIMCSNYISCFSGVTVSCQYTFYYVTHFNVRRIPWKMKIGYHDKRHDMTIKKHDNLRVFLNNI